MGRHTFCTRLCERETNLKIIQSIMGHKDIQTTMDIYAEATEEKKQETFEGKITMKEAQSLIDSCYEERPVHLSDDERTEEADKVSSRIVEILSETAFSFSPNEYIAIHRKLFQGIYKHAGKIRDYNITKKEWVLDGATVMYGSASELRATLEYVFSQEKDFSYKGLSMDEIIHHLAVFISRLWQIHIFGEGNTRTTAVFFIKYLRTLGFSATNDIFAENAWYFRNALVRANYTNLQKGIHETTEYLEAFLRNLLLNEKNELHNRNLHISGLLNEEKVDIGDTKVDIESVISEKGSDFSVKTIVHIHRLFEKFGFDEAFVFVGAQDFFGEVEGVVCALLEGEARVFAEVFQGDQVAVSKGMAFPHVDIDAAFQDWVEFQIELMEKFLQDFVVEVVQVKDADLAFEIFYVGDDVVGAGFVDSEFVFVHSELLHHFHEGIYCEGVVLHGNTEFLLGMFFGNVFGFDQFVLLYHLAGVA